MHARSVKALEDLYGSEALGERVRRGWPTHPVRGEIPDKAVPYPVGPGRRRPGDPRSRTRASGSNRR